MVEFVIGRNIKTKTDKLIAADKTETVLKQLNTEEQKLSADIKKLKTGKIETYNLGGYNLHVSLLKSKMSGEDWRLLGGECFKKMQHSREVKIAFPGAKAQNIYEFALGIELAGYRFDKYFTKKPQSFYPELEKIVFAGTDLKNMDGYKPFAGLVNGVRYARDLINEPANALTPEIFAADIKRLEYLGLKVEILDEKAMKEAGFNLALAVGQGSLNKPRVGIVSWQGNPDNDEIEIGLVGKGVTFDSGGISLKSPNNMGEMKQDMTGAAVMVASLKVAALQKIKKNIVAVVGLVENMPSGAAYRPGDVVTSMSGQTVEVIDTDAEGRLVLADCLTYIQRKFEPKYVIDAATLTGAITIALGSTYAGLFSNNVKLAEKLKAAGESSGELLWQLPMHKEYDEQMDSAIADMKNLSSTRKAGSATAACFLQRFIEKNTKWAHLDIAGMDMSDGKKCLYPKGASAYGVRLLNEFITRL